MTKRLTKHNTAITQNTYQQPLSLLECVCVYLSEREKKRLEKRGKGDLVRREKNFNFNGCSRPESRPQIFLMA